MKFKWFKRKPNVEEIANAIIPLFTEDELKVFERDAGKYGILDLKRRIILEYECKRVICSLESAIQVAKDYLDDWREELGKNNISQDMFWEFMGLRVFR